MHMIYVEKQQVIYYICIYTRLSMKVITLTLNIITYFEKKKTNTFRLLKFFLFLAAVQYQHHLSGLYLKFYIIIIAIILYANVANYYVL